MEEKVYAGLKFRANWADTTSRNVTAAEVIGCWETIMEDSPTKKEKSGVQREFPPPLLEGVIHNRGEKGRGSRIFNLLVRRFNGKMSCFRGG